jgi:hypothetical protein
MILHSQDNRRRENLLRHRVDHRGPVAVAVGGRAVGDAGAFAVLWVIVVYSVNFCLSGSTRCAPSGRRRS